VTEVLPAGRHLGRPRDPAADRAILEATIELLAEEGFGRLSIEGIAARAGVGKTTVYRRWPSKVSLVVDAIAHLKAPSNVAITDDMTTAAALELRLLEFIRATRPSSSGKIMAALVGEMCRNHELAHAVRSALITRRRDEVTRLLERGIERGELRPGIDLELVSDLLGGPIVMRVLLTGSPIGPAVARAIVATVLEGVGMPAPR
jgi:AcrR family transcriptional regulator